MKSLLDFHESCVLCGAENAQSGWCSACLAQLANHRAICCSRCAEPLSAPAPLCGKCLQAPPHFARLTAAMLFEYPLSGLIHAWKYQSRYELSGALAYLVGNNLPNSADYDFVIPVPLAKQRLVERGFNQSAILAKELAKRLKIKFSDKLCVRKHNTVQQAHLDAVGRRKNLRNAFAVAEEVKGLSVLLVDDVATSCCTLSELAKTCKKSGAAGVDAWVLARAVLRKT